MIISVWNIPIMFRDIWERDLMINGMVNVLIFMALLLGVFVIAWIIYSVIWSMYFVPINKGHQHDRKIKKLDDTKFRLETKLDRIAEEIDVLRGDYAKQAISNTGLETEIQRKQQLLKNYDLEFKEFRKWKEAGSPVIEITEVTEELKKENEIADQLEETIDKEIEVAEKEKDKKKPKAKASTSTVKKAPGNSKNKTK